MKQVNNIEAQQQSLQNQAAQIALELYNLKQREDFLNNEMRKIKGGLDVLQAMEQNNDNPE